MNDLHSIVLVVGSSLIKEGSCKYITPCQKCDGIFLYSAVPKTHATLMLHLSELRLITRTRIGLHLHASGEHETGDIAIVNKGVFPAQTQ